MFKRFFEEEETSLDELIAAVELEMNEKGPLHEDYPSLMTSLERLTDIKTKGRREKVSRDTLAVVAGNLLGILLIVAYEQKHVMTSKGFNQIIRPRTDKQIN